MAGGIAACVPLLYVTQIRLWKSECVPRRSTIAHTAKDFSFYGPCRILCVIPLIKKKCLCCLLFACFACLDTSAATHVNRDADRHKQTQILVPLTCHSAFTWEPVTGVSARGYQGNAACIIQQPGLGSDVNISLNVSLRVH